MQSDGQCQMRFLLQGGGIKMFWNQRVVMVIQDYEYTKKPRILYFKRVNLTVCEFYLHKAVKKLPTYGSTGFSSDGHLSCAQVLVPVNEEELLLDACLG